MVKRLALPGLLVLGSFLAGLVVSGKIRDTGPAAPPQAGGAPAATVQPVDSIPASATLAGSTLSALPDFTAVAARTINSVTNIASAVVTRVPTSPFANDPFFRYFFGDAGDMYGYRNRREESRGSGVIVSPDGYILTNAHVVGQSQADVTVTLADKRDLVARIVGIDEVTDLAVLKVEASDLPVIPWGDSTRLKVAEWVLAIGNPFQFNQTVTLGIISALGRTNIGIVGYEDFIQTDAAINPGNSGGALINANGELIGVNTAIYSETGGYQGIGFAVPAHLARRIMKELIDHGQVSRGSIGFVQLVPISPNMTKELGLRSTRGALVWQMRRDAAAYRAGLQPGDVIVSANGQPIDDPSQFNRIVLDAPLGSTLKVGILREGRAMEIEIPVGRPATPRRG
jgi:Do/DeqQ family serine protease